MKIQRECRTCGNQFSTYESQIKKGGGLYCSRLCMNTNTELKERRSKHMKSVWEDPKNREKLEQLIKVRSQTEEWKSAEHFQRGEAHPKYTGNGAIRRESMGRYEYKSWRTAVLKRDGYTCCHCKVRGGRLVAHHIQPWAKSPDLRFDVSNGQSLCTSCHDAVHGLKRRDPIFNCIDCGAVKRWKQSGPRCRACAGRHGFSESRRKKQRPCEHCGQMFTPPRPDTKYCGSDCVKKARRKRIVVQCSTCGKDLERRPSAATHMDHYCNRECNAIGKRGAPRSKKSRLD